MSKKLNKMLCPGCDRALDTISGKPKYLACTNCKRVFLIVVDDAKKEGFVISFIRAFIRGISKIIKNIAKKM